MKNAIIIILVIALIGIGGGLGAECYDTKQDLEAANQALEAAKQLALYDYGIKQSQQGEITRLKNYNESLKQELEIREERCTLASQKLQRLLDKTQEDLYEAQVELREAREKLAQSTIVGLVYADANYNQALDWRDHKVTGNITGFKVVLYTSKKRNDGSFEHLQVASTTVSNGEYRFTVDPGEYFVSVSYTNNQLYSRRYNHIIHINGENMIIGNGEIVVGPTILLVDNDLG